MPLNLKLKYGRLGLAKLRGLGKGSHRRQDRIETVEDLFQNLKPLWRYLTSSWLVMVNEKGKRLDRAGINPVWQEVQKAFDSFAGDSLISRERQKQWQEQAIISGAIGYLTSFAAFNAEEDIVKAAQGLLYEGQSILREKDTTFQEEVRKKMKRMGMRQVEVNH